MARKIECFDAKKLRYILYARKSTEDKGSQERSIEDQLSDCNALVEREGLHIVKVIREEKSAKIENNRPLFTEMLDQIRSGKADGIVSWHPDRLSRNPIESAYIVDMLDKGIIKDLKFPTCQFSNDSSGKMLLNILFAISKQYSEHISEGVIRANDSALEEGKSNGVPKWGYNRNRNGYYIPDDNFDYIRKAWDMKLAGENHTTILDFLLENDVHRMTKITRKNSVSRRITPNINGLAKMFQDTFYYGLLIQAKQEVDLIEATDGAFQPMISYAEYCAVQDVSAGQHRSHKKRAVFYPLRGMVKCGLCGGNMTPSAPKGHGGKYLNYYCNNKDCYYKKHGVRGKCIFEPFFKAIRQLCIDEKQYDLYSSRIDSLTDERLEELRMQKHSLEARYHNKESALKKSLSSLAAAKETRNPFAVRIQEKELSKVSEELATLEEQLDEIKDKLSGATKLGASKEDFLNLLQNLPEQIENASIAEKDAIARIMLLNLTIDQEKRPHFLWKEPFKSLLEAQQLDSGAPD